MVLAVIGAVLLCVSCGTSGQSSAPATVTVTAPVPPDSGTTASQAPTPQPAPPPAFAPAPVLGQVDMLMGDEAGYRLAGTLVVHEAVSLESVLQAFPAMLSGRCGPVVAAWDQTAAGAVQIDVSAVDLTPAGFALPATTRLYLSGGLLNPVIASPAPAAGFVPSACSGASIATGAPPNMIFVLMPGMRTPASPQGDLSVLGDLLGAEAIELVAGSIAFPPVLSVIECSASGGLAAGRDLEPGPPGAGPSADACRLSFA